VEGYFDGGAIRYLTRAEAQAVARALAREPRQATPPEPLNVYSAPGAAAAFIRRMPPCPDTEERRGIVICGGGVRMFTNAWVCLRMLRRLGCSLPIELWHHGERELDEAMRALVSPYGVTCVDAARAPERLPTPAPSPWVLKPFAVVHSRFREVLLLDADNVPVRNPEYLFDSPSFRRTGAVFWPDYGRLAPNRSAWAVFDVPYQDEPEFESGQLLVNKARCGHALRLALWYNEHARFFYQHVFGDKETFHLAFRRLGAPYAMPARPIRTLPGAMCQHDFQGRRLFQHRNTAKWRLFGANARVRGFQREAECLEFLRELGQRWNGRVTLRPPQNKGQVQPPRLPSRFRDVSVAACMISCRERDPVRRQTLAHLARTDWADRPVHVQMDARWTDDRMENITHTAWQAFHAVLQSPADYVLYLEDDLEFNRHLHHNLLSWERVRARQLTLATLYNAGFAEIGWEIPPRAFAFDARHLMGAQAVLLARSTVEFLLQHWFEGPMPIDLKMGALAARLNRPVFCHTPSLVQHVGRRSIWGGGYHRAWDFDQEWKAPDA
jgi:hypothetical protein